MKLKDIAIKIGSGLTPSRSNPLFWNASDLPWIKTEQLGAYEIEEAEEYISQFALDNTSIHLWPKGTVSVAMYGEGQTRGKASILNIEATTNQACCNIVCDPKKADYKYLYYWLTNNYPQLRRLSSGVRKNLNSNDIKNFPFPSIGIDAQNQISKLLSTIDDKIVNNKKVIKELEEAVRLIYDYWFTQFDFPDENGKPYRSSGGKMVWNDELKREIPEGWKAGKTEDMIEGVRTGLNPRQNFKLTDHGWAYLTVKNLTTNGEIDFTNCDFIDDDARLIAHKRSDVSRGDILFASIAPLGRCHLVQADPEDWEINESVFSIRPNTKRTSSEYLYLFLTSKWFIKAAESSSAGSVFKGIRNEELRKLKTFIPHYGVIQSFTCIVRNLFLKMENLSNENRRLNELRDWLLPMLMNGQVKVS